MASLLLKIGEIGRLKMEREVKNSDKHEVCFSFGNSFVLVNDVVVLWWQKEEYGQNSNERCVALVKAVLDIGVALGLLQLAPNKVTPRVTGALGFVTSLISCYQVSQLSTSMVQDICCVEIRD